MGNNLNNNNTYNQAGINNANNNHNMKLSKQELVKRTEDACNERDRWMIFSNAVANGETVSIVRRHPHTLQVVRANGAEGGILNYLYSPSGQRPYVSIHNWETWYASIKHIDPSDKESEQLREAAFAMDLIVKRIQNEAINR
jgi:hypothetical protein